MKITDFTPKQQKTINKIAESIPFNKSGLKNFFIPVFWDKCKHLQGFDYKDIEFLRQHTGQVIYLGGKNRLRYSNWSKPIIAYYMQIKQALIDKKDPIFLLKKGRSKRYFQKVVENIANHTMEQLQDLYNNASEQNKQTKASKKREVKEKVIDTSSFVYKKMKLPICLQGKSDEAIMNYLMQSRMLNKRS